MYSVEEVHSWRLHAERPAHEAPVPVSATTGTGLTSTITCLLSLFDSV